MTNPNSQPRGTVLIIMDGFGIAKNSSHNAIANAKMPFYHELFRKYPNSQLVTHGEAVGLPAGVMGNSEVGHMTIGAGRIIYQDLTRITKSIRDGDFFTNPVLTKTIAAGAAKTGRVHLMGLLSDGGVHSHIDHLLALLDLCVQKKVPQVCVHAFLDGRDTPPNSSFGYLEKLLQHPAFNGKTPGTRASIATVAGRYWAMDRDKRWDRVAKAYSAMTGQIEPFTVANAGGKPLALVAVQQSHDAGKTDEFVEPVLLDPSAVMKDGDSAIFFNYRSDRAREISAAIALPEFKEFERGRGFRPSAFAGMTVYDQKLQGIEVAYGPQSQANILGEWLEARSMKQFRTAETEKYAHVTFFFNGGREQPFNGEDRLLIQSPKDVATYDLKPEMSALEVASGMATAICEKKYDFLLVNFANADMVGHTGNIDAAIRAMEALDRCLTQVVNAAQSCGYHVLITSDHGNAEQMRDESGQLHTQHTLNPVPFVWIPAPGTPAQAIPGRLKDGGLQDIMPTLCKLLNLPLPAEVTGASLI